MRMRRLAVMVATVLVAGGLAFAQELTASRLFTDDMVFQRGRANSVWGTARPGETVTVEVNGKQVSTKAEGDGKWRVLVAELPAGGPYAMAIREEKNTITVKNILCGDVWLCAGQSNMEFSVQKALNAKEEMAAANYPEIRLFTVARAPEPLPKESLSPGDKWQVCSPGSVAWFSAMGYYFGRALHQELKVPIGLIDNSFGGTCAEAWTSMDALKAEKRLAPVFERDKELMEPTAYRKRVEIWEGHVKQWDALPAEERKKWPVVLKWWWKIRPPYGHPKCPNNPAALFNGMLHPLIPFGIKGVIWYQGESNASRALEYQTLLPVMIRDWRARWGQGEFPFLIVQLANYKQPAAQPEESVWAELREAQSMTAASVPSTGLAVTIDVGDVKEIHPLDKQTVGHRLYLSALKIAYGRDVVCSGPTYERMAKENGKIQLFFRNVGGGLVAKGGPLKQFAIAGTDGKFVWADAAIERDTVLVSSPDVSDPVAVRYAWSTNPEGCNLYNKDGLPASPFRTDAPEKEE